MGFAASHRVTFTQVAASDGRGRTVGLRPRKRAIWSGQLRPATDLHRQWISPPTSTPSPPLKEHGSRHENDHHTSQSQHERQPMRQQPKIRRHMPPHSVHRRPRSHEDGGHHPPLAEDIDKRRNPLGIPHTEHHNIRSQAAKPPRRIRTELYGGHDDMQPGEYAAKSCQDRDARPRFRTSWPRPTGVTTALRRRCLRTRR